MADPGPGLAAEKFETPCWVCQKTATLPFKPDGRRPVYCSDCLKKIESGQINPLRPLPGAASGKREREEFGGGLELVGIEFSARSERTAQKEWRPEERKTREFAPRPVQTARPTPAPYPSSGPSLQPRLIPPIKGGDLVVKKPSTSRVLSLSELKAKTFNEIKKDKKSQMDELREALKETLKTEEKPAQSESIEAGKGRILKPGDKIRFN